MRPTRYYSNKQEKKVAKTIGGKQTPNSGATPWVKGDVLTSHFLIECKTATTEKQTFSVPKKWLQKMEEEKFSANKEYAALCFDFGDGENHYIINEKLFRLLNHYIENGDDT